MTWFAFHGLNNGKAIDLAGTQEKQAVAEGFHGYGTEKQAETHPNSVNFLTRTLADTWIADYKQAVKQGAQPGGPNNITTPKGVAGAVVSDTPLGQLYHDIENFIHALTSQNLWIRTAKIVIGGTILIVGLAKLTGADQKIGGITATAVKAAPLL